LAPLFKIEPPLNDYRDDGLSKTIRFNVILFLIKLIEFAPKLIQMLVLAVKTSFPLFIFDIILLF
jgi:hypothetical protein